MVLLIFIFNNNYEVLEKRVLMATEEQNVYITGSSLADWSTEATQAQISGSLKQIQADGNAMIRVLTSIANGTKISSKELKKMRK